MSWQSWNRGLDDGALGQPCREQGEDYSAGYRYAKDIERQHSQTQPQPQQPDRTQEEGEEPAGEVENNG